MRYRFGEHILDTGTLQLLAGDGEVEVEPQVFRVLTHLVAHRDRVVSKEELLDEVRIEGRPGPEGPARGHGGPVADEGQAVPLP